MPRAPRFTERQVAALKAGKRTHVRDTPNLYVIKIANSVNRYFYRYPRPGHVPEINPKTGKPKSPMTEAAVGKPGITLKDAKKIAAQYAQWLRDGIDPQERRNWERVETTTFGDVAAKWLELNKSGQGDSWLADTTNLLRHVEALNKLPIIQVSPEKIAETLLPLFQRGVPKQGASARRVIEQVLTFASAKRLPVHLGQNPARLEIQKELLPKQSKAPRKHYAAMPYVEVPEFVKELRKRRGTGAVALEFVILTACRRSEALKMRWSEINWEQKIWTVPAERMKARSEHRVPLSDRALELLTRQKEKSTGSPYVFTGYTDAPLAEKAMIFAMRKMGVSATVHGFRSAFRDWAGDMTMYARETIEECLAHKVGNAVESAYRRSDALQKRREILDAWAQYVDRGLVSAGD